MNTPQRARSALVSTVAGTSGGFLSGVLGGGGGAIMIPFMTGPLRLRQHVAHGTSLAIIVITAGVAAGFSAN
ncbi:MAG TPA: TSUP family transporter, partial [Tepidiformaceae bacterium]|nr:TSUP family transporter [Tepidiformaceae bacterium]